MSRIYFTDRLMVGNYNGSRTMSIDNTTFNCLGVHMLSQVWLLEVQYIYGGGFRRILEIIDKRADVT